ncbi:MAG: hypothetical protein MRQ13_01710 [Candidatus Midichloria sp.]|nr:hypothetical protein [Candidatus Midichloria sp.]
MIKQFKQYMDSGGVYNSSPSDLSCKKATLLSHLHSMTPAAVGSGIGDCGTHHVEEEIYIIEKGLESIDKDFGKRNRLTLPLNLLECGVDDSPWYFCVGRH